MDSQTLAHLTNTHAPLTPEDAAECPLDWIAGIYANGEVHEVDAALTTADVLTLKTGAAIRWSPSGAYCGGRSAGCSHVRNGAPASYAGHWAPADYEEWADTEDCGECGHDDESSCGVQRDARTVYVWDANGYSETDTYTTIDEAKAAYLREVSELRKMVTDLGYHAHDDED